MSDVEPQSEVVSEEWHDGPMDWPDVPVIQRALEIWESGPRIDFDISENVFFQLLGCDGADDDFFSFQPGKVRWKDMPTRGYAGRKQLADWQSAGDLDFPIKFSRAACWYCFANTYTPCTLPGWVPKVLQATNWDAARAVLEVAQDEARDALTSAAQVFANTPKRPALAYAEARALEQVARERARAVEGCIEALARALREAESPPSVGVIVQIGGRDAIPVRALPYVTGWALAPDTLVKLLHNTSKHWPSTDEDRPRSPWLTAYRLLPNGDCQPVPPRDWQLVEIAIEGFDSELDASQHDHRHGYAQWRRRAMEHFPFDYFVWRDELEDRIYGVPEWNRVVRLGDDLSGGGKLNYAPLFLPGMREMVMEGFEETAHKTSIDLEEPQHPRPVSILTAKTVLVPSKKAHKIQRLVVAAVNDLPSHLRDIHPGQVMDWLRQAASNDSQSRQLGLTLMDGKPADSESRKPREITRKQVQDQLGLLKKREI